MAKIEGHNGKVNEIRKALRDQLGLKDVREIPITYSLKVQKTATDMWMLDKVAEEIQDAEQVTTEVGSMGQQKPTVNPLIPYFDKLSARVTDDLYNLGLTARKQAQKTEENIKVDKADPMAKMMEDAKNALEG